MDTIFIRELEIEAVIGVYDWERRVRQTLVLDIEMGCDVRRAAASDAIGDTLDYKAAATRIAAFARDSQFQLVETLAERAAELLLREFNAPWVRITVRKPGALAEARTVGVTIERGVREPSRPG